MIEHPDKPGRAGESPRKAGPAGLTPSEPVRVGVESTNIDPGLAGLIEPKPGGIHPAGRATGGPGPRIALAHDWLCGYRGGEGVLERLARLAPAGRAHLYTMFDDGRPVAPAVDALPRTASPLSRLPMGPTRLRRWLLPLYPRAVGALSAALAEDHRRAAFDLVLSSSSAAVKGLRPPEGVPHVCYCHAPARYIWSQTASYARDGALKGLGLRLAGPRFRAWDLRTAAHVTRFIANSSHIAREIERCYGREARVIHPPVRAGFFTPPAPGQGRLDFWLVVSALEPYKRVDLAIRAANEARQPLWIVGDGSCRAELESIGGDTVHFLGRVGDEELRGYYRRARALIFPQVEDFGIVAAEAVCSGLPVVARRAGGALDIVREGVTGVFFDDAADDDRAVAALRDAAKRIPDPTPADSTAAALRFDEERFDREILEEIDAALG